MPPHPAVLISQEERIARFGVLCTGPARKSRDGTLDQPDGIVFRGGEWEPGGEYVQKLTVKNVTTKMKKLKYRLPTTRYFSLAFPETIELSPGMSVEIDVIFRPIREEMYEDTIYFKLEELPVGTVLSDAPLRGFHVPVRALLSTLRATCPLGLDMGLCPTAEVSERTFLISNTGEVPAPFCWTVPAPFRLEPLEGTLAVGEEQVMTAFLRPTQASVFVARATCEVGRGVNAIRPEPVLEMKLSAIGKFVHVELSDQRVDFGDVLAGSGISEETTREVVVSNTSVVPAVVDIRRVESDCEPVFSVHPESLVVPPQGEAPVTFHARAAGTYTAEHLEFVTPGGNRPRILLTGSATAPVVRVYKKEDPFAQGFGVPTSVNFGSVEVGKTQTRALFVENASDSALAYQFLADDGGTFTLSKYQGVLPAKLEVPIKLVFAPDRPINYYRRLFLLVEHRAEINHWVEHRAPLFVDLLGTAYVSPRGEVKEQRPAPLRHAHLQAFRNRVAAGLGQASPDELEELLEEIAARGPTPDERLLFARIGARGHDDVLLKTATADPVTRSGEATRAAVAVAHDLFHTLDHEKAEHEIQLSHGALDFGCQPVGAAVERKRTLTVTNTTRAKITVCWKRAPSVFVDGEDAGPDFSVTPESADVADGGARDFKVSYHPRRANAYGMCHLEAAVYFKSQRSFRLVNDAVLAPPWHVQVVASGHSFAGEQFAPALNYEPRQCSFPGCHLGDAGYQSLKMMNRSNLPALFRVEPDPTRAFSLAPAAGLIPAGGFQLLVARFEPREARAYAHRVRLTVNGEETPGPVLVAAGHSPRARLVGVDECTNPENGAGHVTFQPTCVGLTSQRSFRVHNCTRVPLVFDAVLPNRAQAEFALQPRTGVLRGNESATVTVTFAPGRRGLRKTKCVVAVRPLAGPPPPSRRDARQLGNAAPAKILQKIVARLIAPASCGVVAFEPPVLEYPTLLVNTTESRELVLANASDCAVQYSMDHVARRRAFAVGESEDPEATARKRLAPVPSAGRAERLLVDEPTGVLPARSRRAVKVTFQPDAAGAFEFACVCRVEAIAPDGRRVAMEPAAAALLTLGAEDRGTAVEKAVVRGADPFAPGLAEELAKTAAEVTAARRRRRRPREPALLPLTCVVKGRASFPTVVLRDVRVEGARLGCSTPAMWAHFSMASLNDALLTPLTRDEVSFNLESSPDLSRLERFPLEFVPEPLGSPPQVVLVDVRNPGLLPTTFSIHLPNERDIELEPWADEGEPTEADVKINRVIDELKCFDVSPKRATLAPGESVTLRFAYCFSSREFDGLHELPVLLRVAQGKQLWLDLQGKTLSQSEAMLVVAKDPRSHALPLHAVAAGTRPEHAPLQTVEIVNVGGAALEYDVSFAQPVPRGTSPELGAQVAAQLGCELLACENPRGHVPAYGATFLRMRFLPIQCVDYEAPLKIAYTYADPGHPGGSRSDVLEATVTATGYDPRDREHDPHGPASRRPDARYARAPEAQVVAVPLQKCVLSRELLSFGRLPQRAHVHRLVTIRAPAPEEDEPPLAFEFQWEAAHELVAAGVVDVEPLSGVVEAGAAVVCRVIVRADCGPRVVDASLLVLVRERRDEAQSRAGRRGTAGTGLSEADTRAGSAASPSRASQRQSLVTRCTVSRERSLTQTTLPGARLPMMPTSGTAIAAPPPGAEAAEGPPQTAPGTAGASRGADGGLPPPPATAGSRSGTAGGARAPMLAHFAPPSAASLLSGADDREDGTLRSAGSANLLGAGSFLRLRLKAEVVGEAQHLDLHNGREDMDALYIPRPLTFIPPPRQPGDPSDDEDVPNPEEEPQNFDAEKVKVQTLRATMGALVQETLHLHEVRSVFKTLPKEPRVPLYAELKPKELLSARLAPAVELREGGRVALKDLRAALVAQGVKATFVQTKQFMKRLRERGDDVVAFEAFVDGLEPEIQLAVVRALDATAHRERVKTAEARKKARMLASALSAPTMRAAARLQNIVRGRRARLAVAHKKWALSGEGVVLMKCATTLQANYRGMQARRAAEAAAKRRLDRTARRLLADAPFQGMVHSCIEGTLFNLVQEALHHEFDLTATPVQRCFND